MDDLLLLNDSLHEDERMIRDGVAQWIENDLIPKMPMAFENAQFPQDFVKQAAQMGLLGMTLPEVYGGVNASYVAYGLVCQELERGDSGLRSFVSVQSSLCMYPIFRFGSELQKERFLKKWLKVRSLVVLV